MDLTRSGGRSKQDSYKGEERQTRSSFYVTLYIEHSAEWQAPFYVKKFINFEKFFESIHRKSLWKI
jgi:hypothetical protein